ncbi:MAG: hypothetical protein D6706_18685, partial [Chloroflexi bacterium]
MSRKAWFYVLVIILVGVGLSIGTYFVTPMPEQAQFSIFVVLTVLATFSQLVEALEIHNQTFHPTMVFFIAGVLLLHPFLYVLLVLIPHLVEWIKERWLKSPRLAVWYIQPFNIAMHIIAGLGARWILRTLAVDPTRSF